MRPMLATPGALPVGPEWSYEVKWDGVRALCSGPSGRLRITGRSGSDLTGAFPELVALGPVLAGLDDPVLDGELVCLDEAGVPRFAALAPRLHVARSGRAAALAAAVPATFVAFDLLARDGADLTGEPYERRRDLLESLGLAGPRWQVPGRFDDGEALLEATRDAGVEGVMAKRRGSRYRPGVRSPDWVKVPHRRTRSFVVGGWKAETGSRDRLGSLLVGTPVGEDVLAYDGAVGSGLGAAERSALVRVLADLERPAAPFEAESGTGGTGVPDGVDATVVRWSDPVLVVDVAHLGRSGHGRLRQPAVVRLRPDLSYDDVLEQEVAP